MSVLDIGGCRFRDLSDNGKQPMVDARAGVTVTFNGEIYNDHSLRQQLSAQAGATFATACDTEVIAPAYRHWGLDAFLKFEGMFALALWDEVNERLILARDPIGIKPLYYSQVGNSLRFASEIKALLVLDDQPRTLSPTAIHSFLAQGYPGPKHSLIAEIQPLSPGSVLVADRNGINVTQYWRPERKVRYTDQAEAMDHFATLWRQVVDDLLISDVPVGLLLSGGIDSALVAAALDRKDGLKAYTARFDDALFDETSLSAASANHAGMDQVFVSLDLAGDLETKFLDVVAKSDGQLADSSSLAFYSLCQHARGEVPVLLTGDGADEFFAGYETYRATRIAACLDPVVPGALAGGMARLIAAKADLNRGRANVWDKAARFLAGMANGNGVAHSQWRRYLFPEMAEGLYGPAMTGLHRSVDPLSDYSDAYRMGGSVMDSALLADQIHYLPGDLLMKSDTMSMAHGVEVRVPFLDRRIMEFANSLDVSMLSPMRGPDKKFLRDALGRVGLPDQVTRAPKRGFNIPIDAYLRGPLRPLGERLLYQNAGLVEPFLRADAVRTLWRAHLDGELKASYVIWSILTLAAWRDMASL